MSKTQAPDPAQAPRPFDAVKSFADGVLKMLDKRIKVADRASHPFNDYFGDKPEAIVAAKAQASELREVRTQVRILGDRALVDLMKFKPAIPAPEGAQADERAAFEAAYVAAYPVSVVVVSDMFDREADGEYVRPTTQAGWRMWQARAALAAPAPQADEVLIAIKRGEDYQDVHPELVAADALGNTPFEWRVIDAAPQTKEPTNDR